MSTQTSTHKCVNLGCYTDIPVSEDYCFSCKSLQATQLTGESSTLSNAILYPKYFKSVKDLTDIDVYQICDLFEVNDPSGATQHAIKKLLLSGQRTGNKSKYLDLKEARDTLNRRLEMLDHHN